MMTTIHVSGNDKLNSKMWNFAKPRLLDLELHFLYSKRSILVVESYSLFKYLTCNLNTYNNEQVVKKNMLVVIYAKFRNKVTIHKKNLLFR